jgi:hypothetical protein
LKAFTKVLFDELVKSGKAEYIPGLKNPVKIEGDTTRMFVRVKDEIKECLIDTDMLPKISDSGLWLTMNKKKSLTYYILRSKKWGEKLMHRFIMDCPPEYVVDHINGNGFDNRVSNLRIVTRHTNCNNRKKNTNAKNTVKCVSQKDGRYRVTIAKTFLNKDVAESFARTIDEIAFHYSVSDGKLHIPTKVIYKYASTKS